MGAQQWKETHPAALINCRPVLVNERGGEDGRRCRERGLMVGGGRGKNEGIKE